MPHDGRASLAETSNVAMGSFGLDGREHALHDARHVFHTNRPRNVDGSANSSSKRMPQAL